MSEVPTTNVTASLRAEVRAFLDDATFTPRCDSWLSGFDPNFSRALAQRGWLGMTLPRRYGGHQRTFVERHVVVEELLAAGAPVAAHWVADRQSAPLLLRCGTEGQRQRFLPAIAAGECYFCIGMSEPDAGSDLAAIRTRARRTEDGWRITGTKIWTSHAHRAHHMLTLVRTSEEDDRHAGLSQLIVPLDSPGVDVRPIAALNGEHHFNEVVLDDVLVPEELVVGTPGEGWSQVMTELAFERSGPERFLSTYPLYAATVQEAAAHPNQDVLAAERVGRLTAELCCLRRQSYDIAVALQAGEAPSTAAALVKATGNAFEKAVIDGARAVGLAEPDSRRLLEDAVLAAPGFSLRGGTTEMLQMIVARSLVGGR